MSGASQARRSLTRRIAAVAFSILVIQLALAIGLQFLISYSIVREVIHQRLRDLDEVGFLDGCEVQPEPRRQSEGRWVVWSITAEGRVLGPERPIERVALPAVGDSRPVEVEGGLGAVYATDAPGCGGVLFVYTARFPVIQALSREFMTLAVGRLVLLALAGLAMALATAWPLVRRIRSLVERMNAIVDEGFEGRVELGTNDELGDLALAFDAAARTAHERLAALEHRDQVLRRALADLAHDLRTPLATLKLSASSLEASPAVTAIRTELSFLEGLSQNFEALIEDDPQDREAIELAGLIERLELRFAPLAADRGLAFNVAVPDGDPRVLAEAIALERAVGNLIHNALRWASANVVVLAWIEDDEARIEVRDDGPGLDGVGSEAVERGVRGPNARGEGFGLGLAIAEAAARRHGGRLELRAGLEGVGTRATIVLPLPS